MTTRTGAHLGRYEIEAEIGRGAMGVVHRARDPKIDRLVAIKTISLAGLDAEAEAEYRTRFFVEAQAAGRLSHPGIVTIFDVGEEAETRSPYIVMEYVTGQSLHKMLSSENKNLPLGTALELAQEIAEALDYAHGQGVVHRDIKPANILLTAAGRAKIADFGIAQLNQAHLTLPGHVLGSPAFMAPEQLSGEGVDARSDLFSLGVILYTMLTGHRPFQGNSATTVCFKVVHHEPVSVTAFDSEFPAELAQIVSRAMAKNPAERYQTGLEMALAIQRLRESTGLLRGIHEPQAGGGSKHGAISHPQERLRLATTALKRWLRAPWKVVIPAAVALAGIAFLASRGVVNVPERIGAVRPEAPAATAPESPNLANRVSKPAASRNAKLQIEIKHDFAQAHISVWSDNQLVYSQTLQAEHRTQALLLRKVQGRESDTVWVPAGRHQVKVRIQSTPDHYDHFRTVAATLAASGNNILRITGDKKHNLLDVALQ